MDKNKLKLFVDVLMFVDFLALAFSGGILKFILPRGSGRLADSFVISREGWLFVHNLTSLFIVILVLIHLILNWVWIKSMIVNIFKRKNDKEVKQKYR